MGDEPELPARPRYRWPPFVLALFLAGLALAVVWMSHEVRRLREFRDPNPLSAPAGQPAPQAHSQTQGPAAGTNSIQLTNGPLAEFREALHGGDAVVGRKVFFEKPEASCAKCHKVGGQGGDTGPALDGIGSRQTREFILESMISPNCRTLEGYETVIVLLKDGSGCSGFLKKETENELVIHAAEEGLITIKKSEIQVRQKGLSPMPEGLGGVLSRQDLRDVIEFVASLKN